MNLMISVNDLYCEPAKVMLASFLSNNSFEHNDIYFLYGNVASKSIAELSKFVETRYDASFHQIKIDENKLPELPVFSHFSKETYYRFFAQEVLPQSADRVLWLDVDMIVRCSLKEFYYQDFEGKSLVVCRSINKDPKSLLDKMELPEDTVYFNAGTILFNLDKIREEMSVLDYFDYIENNREKITWLDQDVLNALFCKKTKVDDYKKYNMQMFSEDKFTKDELAEIDNCTCIVHYIGTIKPWDFRYENPCGKYYQYYSRRCFPLFKYFIFVVKRFLFRVKKMYKMKVRSRRN